MTDSIANNRPGRPSGEAPGSTSPANNYKKRLDECLLKLDAARKLLEEKDAVLEGWMQKVSNLTAEMQQLRAKQTDGDNKNTPLDATVVADMLVITIGVETLAWAADPKNGGKLDNCKVDGRRRRQFAQDVARAMCEEDEVGNSPLNAFIDEMMEAAAEAGSGALIWSNIQS